MTRLFKIFSLALILSLPYTASWAFQEPENPSFDRLMEPLETDEFLDSGMKNSDPIENIEHHQMYHFH